MFHDLGLNKDFKKMLSEKADFKALAVKDIHTASDGTRKVEIILLYFVFSSYYIHFASFSPSNIIIHATWKLQEAFSF